MSQRSVGFIVMAETKHREFLGQSIEPDNVCPHISPCGFCCQLNSIKGSTSSGSEDGDLADYGRSVTTKPSSATLRTENSLPPCLHFTVRTSFT